MNKNQYKKGHKNRITLKERVSNLECEVEELKKQIEVLRMNILNSKKEKRG